METMTETKLRQVFIGCEVLASINSLTQFADTTKNPTSPILAGVFITRHEDNGLRVYATNRYVLARGTYIHNVVSFQNWDHDETLWIDHGTLKQAATIAKGFKLPMIALGYDTENRVFINVDGNKLFNVAGQPSYPPVDRMFNDDAPNGVERVSLNPKWLAMLSKVLTPTTRQDKDMPWELSLFHDTESNKPKPVVARLYPNSDTEWEIRVLIQPNLVVR
jgi:hypothetical protein